MTVVQPIRFFLLLLPLFLLIACSDGGNSSPVPGSLSADNINLLFVVTPDLTYSTTGDINPDTANLTNQGLQRSLMMDTYLKQQVLGGNNVTGIYTISPMSHLQTANNYPDMAAIGFIQQFAMLNQTTLKTAKNSDGCWKMIPSLDQNPLALLQSADKALYAAKRLGRNRVHHFV